MKYTINLFPQPEQTVVDKTIYFVFHYLRYILVITQFVVICVFFFRFKVDQEIVDLKDGLQQKKEIISATETLLDEVEVVDGKITVVKDIMTEQELLDEMLLYFFSQVPSRIDVSNLTVLPNSLHFTAETYSIDAIQVFYDTLNKEERFEEVIFEQVTKEKDTYSFSFQLVEFKSLSHQNES